MLAYLSGRLACVEVLLAVGMRHECGKHQLDALARVRANASITLSLHPLSAPAIADLLASEAVGTGDEIALRTITGGLPSILADLVHLACPTGSNSVADLTALAVEVAQRSVPVRLAQLDDSARATLQAASLLGEFDRSLLSVMLGLSPHEIDQAVMAAAALGLLELDGGPRFAHSQLRGAVRATVPSPLALEWHCNAANELLRCGARPERTARHIVALAPQGRADWAHVLYVAGRAACTVGDLPSGVALLRRALLEPPSGHQLPDVREALIAGLVRLDDHSWRFELASARAEHPEVQHRFEASAGWASYLRGDSARASLLLRRAWESIADPSSDEAIGVLTKRAIVNRVRVGVDVGLVADLEAVAGDAHGPERSAIRALQAYLAYERSLGSGSAESVIGLAARAFDPQRVDADELIRNAGLIVGLLALMFVDATAEFDEVVTRVRPEAERRGTPTLVGAIANVAAAELLAEGAVREARTEASRAVELLGVAGAAQMPGALGNLALATLHAGDVNGAEAALTLADTGRWVDSSPYTAWLYARGCVRRARGDNAGALEDYLEVGRRHEVMGITNPVILPWWHGAAMLHVAAGDLDAAHRVLSVFEPAAERVGTVRCRALVSRTEARILAASDPSAAAVLLNDAAEQLRDSPYEAALWDVLLDCSALARAAGDRAIGRSAGARGPLQRCHARGWHGDGPCLRRDGDCRPPAQSKRPQLDGADTNRAARRRARRRWSRQPRDRRRALCEPKGCRVPPHERLPKARNRRSRRASRQAAV